MAAAEAACRLLLAGLALWPWPWLWSVAAPGGQSPVKVLSDGLWRELLRGEWMVEFYAPWCPACQSLQPEWEKFAEWGKDLEVNVAKVDVTKQPGLSGRFVITALPTIYHCKDGEFRRYQGARTKTAFINFIRDQEWKSIEPVSSWFGPSSLLMSSVSALFQLSMWIRQCHNYLTENVGIPIWGSYALLALATLFLGVILVLMVVFLADSLFPSRRPRPAENHRTKKPDGDQQLCEEQEADEEGISDDGTESREESRGRSPQNAVRQRTVTAGATGDAS